MVAQENVMKTIELPTIRIDLADKIDPTSEVDTLISPLFVTYKEKVDITPLLQRIADEGELLWQKEGQTTNVSVHRAFHDDLGVKNIPFTFCDDLLTCVYRLPWWDSWENELTPIFQQLGIPPKQVIRCLLAKLPAGREIPVHHDTGLWSTRSHRVHVPICTSEQNGNENEQVVFKVGKCDKTMKRAIFPYATAIELNNRSKHAVCNNWNRDRIHLIFDYVEVHENLPIQLLKLGDHVIQTRRSIAVVPAEQPFTPPVIAEPPQLTPEEKSKIIKQLIKCLRDAGNTKEAEQRFIKGCKKYGVGEMRVDEYVMVVRECLKDKLDAAIHVVGLPDLIFDGERRETFLKALGEKKLNAKFSKLNVSSAVAGPSFIVIGVMKCGTTSLYDYITQHPTIARARSKEPHFFDWKWDKLEALKLNTKQQQSARKFWNLGKDKKVDENILKYAHVFNLHALLNDRTLKTGEATPSYILGGSQIAQRIKKVSPNAKFLVALRDPTKRAYSHYQMTADPEGTPEQKKRRGEVDGKTFEMVLDEDFKELEAAGVTSNMDFKEFDRAILSNRPQNHGSHSYVTRGLYALQIEQWFDLFPREQFHFVKIEDLKPNSIQATMNDIWDFLDVPPHTISDVAPKNARKYDTMTSEVESKLRSYYAPHNQRLSQLLGMDFSSWN